jgi:hypothetical protein
MWYKNCRLDHSNSCSIAEYKTEQFTIVDTTGDSLNSRFNHHGSFNRQ